MQCSQRRCRLVDALASSLLTLAAVAVAITAGVLLAASAAQAACIPTAGSAPPVTPPPGTTVTCTGATVNQNPPNGYGTGNQTGITVNVDPGASVTGSATGMSLGSDNTINNSGTISGSSGLRATSNTTVNNSGTISATGSGTGVSAFGTITNSGAISGSTGIQAIGGSVGITNSGTITGTGGTAIQFTVDGRLTITPTSVINGNVNGVSASVFQLGGTGSGSFNVSLIGSTQQYRGFGSFEKVGTSTWTLTGIGTQRWTVSDGTLVGNTSSLQGSITNNAALVFDQASNGTYASSISGTGNVTKQNSGTLTLTGANTYSGGTTISAGTLQLGNGGATGSIMGDVANNGIFAFNRSNGYSFGGVISGTGAVEQNGTGSTTLTAVETYTGATTVNAGVLLVNGSIASSSGLTVNAGGTVGGIGTLPSTTINNGGTLAPGNAIGTVTVQGNLSFSPSSMYLVEISPAAADRINVTGTATLAGNVHVVPAAGSYVRGTTYTILNAAGGVTGTFSGFTIDSAFLCACLSYDANNVYLTITTKNFTFADAAQTPNQRATGITVERFGTGNPIYDVVVLGTAEQARTAFDLLSGEIHASIASALLEDSHHLRNAVIGRLRQSYASSSGPFATLSTGGPALAYAGSSSMDSVPDSAGKKTAAFTPAERVVATWSQAIGAWGRNDSDGNAATLARSVGGFISGVDATFAGMWRLGAAGGYTRSSLHANDRGSSGAVDSYHLAIYGGRQFGALGLRAGVTNTWHDIETSRSINFSGGEACCASTFNDTVRASYKARTTQAFGEVGLGFAVDRAAIEPFANLAYVDLRTDGFAETGGAAALATGGHSFDATMATLGSRIAVGGAINEWLTMIARGTLGWRHAFGDVTPEMAIAFVNGSAPFGIAGIPIARDAALIEAGIDLRFNQRATVSVSYVGQVAERARDHSIKGGLSWLF